MPETVKRLRIFVASPGDVAEERDRLANVADDLRTHVAAAYGLDLELVRWETHVRLGAGADAQAVVNPQIGTYDLFIGILWNRFGTPTKRAESGTREEFDQAYARWQKDPSSLEIWVYFSQQPYTFTSGQELEQKAKVLGFQKELQEKKGLLVWTYKDPAEFEEQVRGHLELFIPKHASLVRSAPPAETDLLQTLSRASESHKSRMAAIDALSELADPEVVEPLLEALARNAPPSGLSRLQGRQQQSERADIRKAIAVALGQIGDVRAVEPLLAQLKDPDLGPRRAAVQALGQIGDVRAVEPLLAQLKDPDRGQRRAAVQALGQIGDARVTDALNRVWKADDDLQVRDAARAALERLVAPKLLLDFDLAIGPGSGRKYPVSVLRSPAGQARETMRFPFSELVLENRLQALQIALLRSGGKRRLVTTQEEKAVQDFGRELFDALFTGQVRSRYDVSQREAARQDKGLRLRLYIQPPELAVLPWEFLYDPRQAEYVCLSRHTPVVRYLQLPQVIQPLMVTPPLRILGMIASPHELAPLDIEHEKQRVEKAIHYLQGRGLVEITWLEGQTWRDLQRVMRGGPWHIFHFIGHGGFDRSAEEGFIALADEEDKTYRLPATQLARLLADQGSLRLVLLNSCEGARGSQRDIFSSTAAILVRRSIPAVLAMQYEITDQAAIEFARTFYEALADGLPVDAAVTEARRAISLAVTNTIEWGTPVLYMRSPDGVLFQVARPSPEEKQARQEAVEAEPAWLSRLSSSTADALRWAEGLRQATGANKLYNEYLLAGLYQKTDGPTRQLLTLFDNDTTLRPQLESLVNWTGTVVHLEDVHLAPPDALRSLPLSADAQKALAEATVLADKIGSRSIRSRHLLAGLLAVPEAVASRWIADLLQVNRETIHELIAAAPDALPPLEQIRGASARRFEEVATHRWHLSFESAPPPGLRVWEPFNLTLSLTQDRQPGSQLIDVPESTLELTFYIEAPGFHLEIPHICTVPVVHGEPIEKRLRISLIPLISGEQSVRILAYPGGRGADLKPTRLDLPMRIATPSPLPNIPELIDRRTIPDPQPDVMLYIWLEEKILNGQPVRQVRIHVTSPALGVEGVPVDPPLPLTEPDLAGIRRAAAQAATEANTAAPPDALAGLQAFGAALFDHLFPSGHRVRADLDWRDFYWHLSPHATWLVVSDERASLPWEMVCAYRVIPDPYLVQHDEFLGRKFVVSHWIGRQGLKLASEAPVGPVDLTHYRQFPDELPRWQAVLGGEDEVGVEDRAGHLALMQAGSPYYGLHVLRYSDRQQAGQVIHAGNDLPHPQAPEREAGAMLYDQRLDFTLRRPVVSLSFVDSQPNGLGANLAGRDLRVETGWMLPMMHAGASAVVGPRWLVPPDADQLFFRVFYQMIRSGVTLGWAVWQAREQVRLAFPHRVDWLAYAYYGFPECEPYLVRPTQGFVLIEVIDHPRDAPFQAGQEYNFRASYRAEAPVWYDGRLRTQQAPLEGEDVSVLIAPLMSGMTPKTYRLESVLPGSDYQCIVNIKMPEEETTLPVLVRFQKSSEELRSLMLNLDVVETGTP